MRRTVCHAVIRHPRDPAILLLGKGADAELPRFEMGYYDPLPSVAVDALARIDGLRPLLLRRLASWPAEEESEPEVTAALFTLRDGTWTPPSGVHWALLPDIERLDGSDRWWTVVRTVLQEIEQGTVPPGRPPWAEPEWFETADRWIGDRILEAGLTRHGETEQLRSWSISCVMRTPTEREPVYFKAVPPLFAHEPSVTALLADRFPENVPAPLAIDTERGWMLLPEVPGANLYYAPKPVESFEPIVRLLAHMQRQCEGDVPALLDRGLADRRLHVLRTHTGDLLQDEGALASLGVDEKERLRASEAEIAGQIEGLAAHGVPETVLHGDFNPGNVGVDGEAVVIFDWTDGAVGFPFLDLPVFLHSVDWRGQDLVDRLLDAYLSAWSDVAPLAELREIYRIAYVAACAYQAVSYWTITRAVERGATWELEDGTAMWLRRLLGAMGR